MEGDYFVIAAAAYFFVETYIPDTYFESSIPKQITIHEPIQKEAENFIFLIGDGMGVYQTLLYDVFSVSDPGVPAYSDGEDLFYGYLLPNQGYVRTDSRSGVTDSAAAGTALASGYKTVNGYVGKNESGKDVKSLTELAASKGMATAVMSTETSTGATPASFSAHADSRKDAEGIYASQEATAQKYGTLIRCDFNNYDVKSVKSLQKTVNDTLKTLGQDEDGFFMMYEEAYIDKFCHNNNMTGAFYALMRFNQVIGICMEYAFYHPETFVLITADHETGGLKPNAQGEYTYATDEHTGANVPVFTYGMSSDVFDGKEIENTQIPKTLAYLMGEKSFGANDQYKHLFR
jgi:alkaline phosphatase